MSGDERVQYKFMIPSGLKARLEEAAHNSRRSLSAEIIARLEHTLAAPTEQASRDATAANLYPLLVELVEAYQRGEQPVISFKRKQRPEKPE